MNGDWPLDVKLPLVGGHEGAGIVVARGELVQDIEIGDHAGVKVHNPSSKTALLLMLKAFFLTCIALVDQRYLSSVQLLPTGR